MLLRAGRGIWVDLLRALVWVDLLRALVWAARPEVDFRRRAWAGLRRVSVPAARQG